MDQSGHRRVERNTILDILNSCPSVEVFYTFAIESLLAFLPKAKREKLHAQFGNLGISGNSLEALDGLMGRQEWLGTAEKLVFDAFKLYAPFASPFSINNPDGWKYWLIHFARSYRARQVYNNILHRNSTLQAHFGRSGLHMLTYDPRHDEAMLYLFDDAGRAMAKAQLLGDIPHLVSEAGDAMSMTDFYESIYNATPAHADDVHAAIIENPDLEVITPAGGERRKAGTIGVNDFIKLKAQRSFFPMFLGTGKGRKSTRQ